MICKSLYSIRRETLPLKNHFQNFQGGVKAFSLTLGRVLKRSKKVPPTGNEIFQPVEKLDQRVVTFGLGLHLFRDYNKTPEYTST